MTGLDTILTPNAPGLMSVPSLSSSPGTVEDLLVTTVVLFGSCVVLALVLTWYTSEPDD
jgi:hypothetical protein